ncbi:hypothetical protein GQ457_13G016700 [Hibiscus cannabinus]
MFAASFDSKMGCLYSVFNVKKQRKPAWVIRTRNWKLRGVENRLSGLLEGVSIVSSGRQGSKGDRVKPLFKYGFCEYGSVNKQWGGYALFEERTCWDIIRKNELQRNNKILCPTRDPCTRTENRRKS